MKLDKLIAELQALRIKLNRNANVVVEWDTPNDLYSSTDIEVSILKYNNASQDCVGITATKKVAGG